MRCDTRGKATPRARASSPCEVRTAAEVTDARYKTVPSQYAWLGAGDDASPPTGREEITNALQPGQNDRLDPAALGDAGLKREDSPRQR